MFQLICHPGTPARTVRSVAAELVMGAADAVLLTFYVTPGEALAVPAPTVPARTDGLWQRTCFEMFLMPERETGYFEFNLSPSRQWAAYRFDGYRAGMSALELPSAPRIELERQGEAFVMEAQVDLGGIPSAPMRLALSAVVEESDGTKSYWALRHPPGKPDFHDVAGFAQVLAGRP